MNRRRLAALRLALLTPGDRRWLLRRLRAEDREQLATDLPAAMALQAIDPGQCAQWLQQLANSGQRLDAMEPMDVSQECLDAVDCAPVAVIARTLKGLPRFMQVEILRAKAWRWKLALLEQMPEIERQMLLDGLGESGGLKTAARNALLELVADSIGDQPIERQPFDVWMQDSTAGRAPPVVSAGHQI